MPSLKERLGSAGDSGLAFMQGMKAWEQEQQKNEDRSAQRKLDEANLQRLDMALKSAKLELKLQQEEEQRKSGARGKVDKLMGGIGGAQGQTDTSTVDLFSNPAMALLFGQAGMLPEYKAGQESFTTNMQREALGQLPEDFRKWSLAGYPQGYTKPEKPETVRNQWDLRYNAASDDIQSMLNQAQNAGTQVPEWLWIPRVTGYNSLVQSGMDKGYISKDTPLLPLDPQKINPNFFKTERLKLSQQALVLRERLGQANIDLRRASQGKGGKGGALTENAKLSAALRLYTLDKGLEAKQSAFVRDFGMQKVRALLSFNPTASNEQLVEAFSSGADSAVNSLQSQPAAMPQSQTPTIIQLLTGESPLPQKPPTKKGKPLEGLFPSAYVKKYKGKKSSNILYNELRAANVSERLAKKLTGIK